MTEAFERPVHVAMPDTTVEPSDETNRRRVGVPRVVAVVVAALLLVAAGIFFVTASSDRDDATAQRRAAAAQLRTQRARTREAQSALASVQAMDRTGLGTVDNVLHDADDMVALADRELELTIGLQDAGANNSTSRVDEYNDLISRANEVVDQYNAHLAQIEQELDAAARGQRSVNT